MPLLLKQCLKLQYAACNLAVACHMSSCRVDICSVFGRGSSDDSSGGKFLRYKKPATPHILNSYINNHRARDVGQLAALSILTEQIYQGS